MTDHIRIFMIEDNPGDVKLMKELLKQNPARGRPAPKVSFEIASTLEDGLERLKDSPAVVLFLDLYLPDSLGIDTFLKAHAAYPGLPVLVFSSLDDAEVANHAVRAGAQDYLVKGQIDKDLVLRAVSYAINRQQAENALRESEQRYKAVTHSAHEAIISSDHSGMIISWNQGASAIFGYTEEEALGMDTTLLMPKRYRAGHNARLHELRKSTEITLVGQTMELFGLRKNGKQFPIELSLSSWSAGGTNYFTAILRDISARKELENQITQASERERIRIGQDLHDGLGQHLAGIKFMASVLEKKLRTRKLEEADEISQITGHINEAIEQTRTLAKELYPVDLQRNGLLDALSFFSENISKRFGIQCDFDCDVKVLLVDSAVATHLYRIAQEAVNNAVRHGQADRIKMHIQLDSVELVLTIKDNGRGFKADQEKGPGVGLRTMNFRSRVIGGSLHIRSSSGEGTEIVCTLPKDSMAQAAVANL